MSTFLNVFFVLDIQTEGDTIMAFFVYLILFYIYNKIKNCVMKLSLHSKKYRTTFSIEDLRVECSMSYFDSWVGEYLVWQIVLIKVVEVGLDTDMVTFMPGTKIGQFSSKVLVSFSNLKNTRKRYIQYISS